jgi:hypothetical protein
MEDWLLMHRFYYGLTQRSCEQLDATCQRLVLRGS